MINNISALSRLCCNRGTVAMVIVLVLSFSSSGLDFSVAASFDRYFTGKWDHRLPETMPVPATTDTVYPGIPVILHVLFKEYSRNNFGIADLVFSYTIKGPDGRVVADSTGITAFSGIVYADSEALLSRSLPVIVFPRTQTTGRCSFLVTAEDRISGENVSRSISLMCAAYPACTPDRFDVVSFNVWVHNYCIAPDPAQAVSAFAWFVNSESSNNDRIFWPVFYFFQILFHEQPAVVEQLIAAFPESSARVREYTVLLLRLIGARRDREWPIPDALWNKFDAMKETGYLDPFAITFKSKSVPFLEMGFYYYGSYDMVRLLIACLGATTGNGYREFVTLCEKYHHDGAKNMDQKTAMQFGSLATAIVKKAYPKHQLLRSFCAYALEYDDRIAPDAKRALEAIIRK